MSFLTVRFPCKIGVSGSFLIPFPANSSVLIHLSLRRSAEMIHLLTGVHNNQKFMLLIAQTCFFYEFML